MTVALRNRLARLEARTRGNAPVLVLVREFTGSADVLRYSSPTVGLQWHPNGSEGAFAFERRAVREAVSAASRLPVPPALIAVIEHRRPEKT